MYVRPPLEARRKSTIDGPTSSDDLATSAVPHCVPTRCVRSALVFVGVSCDSLQCIVLSQWVGEMVGFADRGHVKGCVIQVTVPRYVQADVLVETFDQEQLDSFFILVIQLVSCLLIKS